MTYTIELLSSFSQYSVGLEYTFQLAETFDSGRNRDLTTIANQNPEAARHFAFQPGQQNPRIEFTLYNNGEDKSNATLLSSSIDDNRLAVGKEDDDDTTGDIVGVDTGNDIFTVDGDVTRYVSSGGSIRVAGSTGNDELYGVSGVSYNSGNDTTDISVDEDVTDSTTDGWAQRGIQTVLQQIIWLDEYLMDNTSDPRWLLFGDRWTDRDGDGVNEGTNVTLENFDFTQIAGQTSANGRLDIKLGVTV